MTALRVRKDLEKVTLEDIHLHSPSILFNGWHEQNMRMMELRGNKHFQKTYGFDDGKLLIAAEQSSVSNTQDQIRDVNREYFTSNGKVVVVSDAYHLPRVGRYFRMRTSPIGRQRIVLYPAQPLYMPDHLAESEINKIPLYAAQGHLPLS